MFVAYIQAPCVAVLFQSQGVLLCSSELYRGRRLFGVGLIKGWGIWGGTFAFGHGLC